MKNLKEWCIEKGRKNLLELYENAKNECKSDEIGFSSGKNANWKCSKCGMEWEQKPNKMTKKKGEECPYCAHERPSSFYNLLIEYPILAEEWDYKLNEKLPSEYLPNSHTEVYWKCKNGHAWKGVIRDRVRSVQKNEKLGKAICPYCNHEKASSTYNLVTENPDIARQWNYIKNGSLKILLKLLQNQVKKYGGHVNTILIMFGLLKFQIEQPYIGDAQNAQKYLQFLFHHEYYIII